MKASTKSCAGRMIKDGDQFTSDLMLLFAVGLVLALLLLGLLVLLKCLLEAVGEMFHG